MFGPIPSRKLENGKHEKPKVCLILLKILKIGSFIYRNGIQNNGTMDELK
jgi:hypothetical protein